LSENSLKICVYGLWHLGCVTAASLAQEGFTVVGLDRDAEVVANLQQGKPPLFEPGLAELVTEGLSRGNLSFTHQTASALSGASIVWVAFDTPVNDRDEADLPFVQARLEEIFPDLEPNTLVLISSQVAAGFTGRLAADWRQRAPQKNLSFGYIPENLRLGNALKTFRAEDRFVVGLDEAAGREGQAHALVESILTRFCPRIEWMSVPSAEMVKHSLNSFLAVSVSLINEIARLCEKTGADAKEVERGLKSESRIGPKAYLGPGGPFAGGTLARDLRFLTRLGDQLGVDTPLLDGTLESNELHKGWLPQTVLSHLQGVDQPKILICGVSYKAGTDTLRRSEAINLGLTLAEQGVRVIYHDPVTTQLPSDLAEKFELTNDLEAALNGTDVLVLATGWPQYREQLNPALLLNRMRRPLVIDQNRYLAAQLANASGVQFISVGSPQKD
jgi:UDPglucose 6-dehydrogenase